MFDLVVQEKRKEETKRERGERVSRARLPPIHDIYRSKCHLPNQQGNTHLLFHVTAAAVADRVVGSSSLRASELWVHLQH
jgi:hypothetical protein